MISRIFGGSEARSGFVIWLHRLPSGPLHLQSNMVSSTYSLTFNSTVIEYISIIIKSKIQNTYGDIKIDYKSHVLPSQVKSSMNSLSPRYIVNISVTYQARLTVHFNYISFSRGCDLSIYCLCLNTVCNGHNTYVLCLIILGKGKSPYCSINTNCDQRKVRHQQKSTNMLIIK